LWLTVKAEIVPQMLTEENFIDFKCPHCEATASFPETDTGFVRACPNCLQDLIVPPDGTGVGLTIPVPVVAPRLTRIEAKETGKLIGYLSLTFTDADRRQATLALYLNEDVPGDDLAIEAIDALLGFCFKGIKMHRITAMCDKETDSQGKVFEAVGMRREAEFIKDRWVTDQWLSSIWYAALEEDYITSEEGSSSPSTA
jgi:hypothetical protein